MTRPTALLAALLSLNACAFSVSSTPAGVRVHEPYSHLALQTALVCTATLVGHWIWGDDAGRWIGYAAGAGSNTTFEVGTYVLRDYADLPANNGRTALDVAVPGLVCAGLVAWIGAEMKPPPLLPVDRGTAAKLHPHAAGQAGVLHGATGRKVRLQGVSTPTVAMPGSLHAVETYRPPTPTSNPDE